MKTLPYVLTISGLTIGTKLIEIAYNFGLRFLIRRTNFYNYNYKNERTNYYYISTRWPRRFQRPTFGETSSSNRSTHLLSVTDVQVDKQTTTQALSVLRS